MKEIKKKKGKRRKKVLTNRAGSGSISKRLSEGPITPSQKPMIKLQGPDG